jgi:hypothetical protein
MKNAAAQELGKLGGSVKSAAKTKSSAANGIKGGRPGKGTIKIYEVQVKDDGEFQAVELSGGRVNAFESREDAEYAMAEHKRNFPFRITTRVVRV